ncbi:MAG: hypothetical protein V7L21_29875 [Nostoc sp.]
MFQQSKILQVDTTVNLSVYSMIIVIAIACEHRSIDQIMEN